ncbi:hypothetical protein [Saccharopolyspora sp. NPDC049426]|uniref:hypothetical protein n=1 Tax=Saccharopolyspora sp. NPDC049426 TaxID=3155652 RepID=UPI00342233B9
MILGRTFLGIAREMTFIGAQDHPVLGFVHPVGRTMFDADSGIGLVTSGEFQTRVPHADAKFRAASPVAGPAELSRDSGERAPNRDRFDGYEAL